MKGIRRTLTALLNLVVLLSLTLSLSAPALGQGPGGDPEVRSATTAPQPPGTGEPITAPAAAPPPLDCSKPLPGKVAKLVDNDEIMLAYMDWTDSYRIAIAKLDDKSDGSKDLVDLWNWQYHLYSGADVTTADLDGDDKAEVIMGYNTGFGTQKGELGAVSLKNPEVDDKSQLETDSWTSSSNYRYGYFGPISVAAGNLDGSLAGGDKADEVVLAFRDADNNRLQVVLLDGESDGGIRYLTWWENTDHGRTYILSLIAVDVGDVDSNGYDDDIVLAFVDKDQDIQVVVLKLNQQGGVTETGWESWTNDDRGDINWKSDRLSIDVATGDFNGDTTDEIAVAFRDGTSALQVMQVVYDPNASTLQGRVNSPGWWRDKSHNRNDVASVSVAAGDIDGDNNEEIISAFADSNNHLGLVTLDVDSANPKLRGSYGSGSGELSFVSFTSVAAGDLDARGQVEVVVSFADHDFDVQVISFNDNPDCPCSDDATSGLIRRDGWTKTSGYPALSVRDQPGRCGWEQHLWRLYQGLHRDYGSARDSSGRPAAVLGGLEQGGLGSRLRQIQQQRKRERTGGHHVLRLLRDVRWLLPYRRDRARSFCHQGMGALDLVSHGDGQQDRNARRLDHGRGWARAPQRRHLL